MSPEEEQKIHQLWDLLVDRPAADSQKTLHLLLSTIAGWAGASQAYWLGAVRVATSVQDPASGWRPRAIQFLHEDEAARYRFSIGSKALETGERSENIIYHTRRAGKFRSYLRSDITGQLSSGVDPYVQREKADSISDTLYVVAPVNRDIEAYFCFHRTDGTTFTTRDRLLASRTLRGLKWFFRQLMIQHGLLLAEKPLTVTERRVMTRLVTKLSEKQIADDLDQKPHTTHQHIKAIYRKFNVNSRAGLLSIWLGQQPG
ncbi:MAG: LuxR C-terminal-related transcriptional regulator [Pseudohongiellaceae bacterium]